MTSDKPNVSKSFSVRRYRENNYQARDKVGLVGRREANKISFLRPFSMT